MNVHDDIVVQFHPIQTTSLTGWFCFAEKAPTKPEQEVESNYIENNSEKELGYISEGLVCLDWTRGWCPMAVKDPEHYQFLRTFDW